MKTTRSWLLAAAVVLTAAGCDQATAPSGSGPARMQVGVRGDQPSSATAAPRGARASQSQASGQIQVQARVYVQSEAGQWVELTSGAAQQTVQASGSDGIKLLSTAQVEAGTYHRVRVEFQRVQGTLGVSLQIGGSISGSVSVDGGSDGTITVERDVAIDARAGATSELDIDLNAGQWASRANAQTGVVSEADFSNAVSITAE